MQFICCWLMQYRTVLQVDLRSNLLLGFWSLVLCVCLKPSQTHFSDLHSNCIKADFPCGWSLGFVSYPNVSKLCVYLQRSSFGFWYGEVEIFVYTNFQEHSKFYINKKFNVIYLATVLFSDPFSLWSFSEHLLFTINPPQNGLFAKSVIQIEMFIQGDFWQLEPILLCSGWLEFKQVHRCI